MGVRTKVRKVLGGISGEHRFDGKTYQLRHWAKTKHQANIYAKVLREKGYSVRIKYVSLVKEYGVFYR